MPSTINYIDESERIFTEPTYFASLGNLWKVTGGTLSVDPLIYQDSDFGSLKVENGQNIAVSYNSWSTPATDIPSQYAITSLTENSDYVECFCWVRPTENCTIRIRTEIREVFLNVPTSNFMIDTASPITVTGAYGTHIIEIGATDQAKWHLIRAVPVQIPNDSKQYSISFLVEIDYESPTAIGQTNISRPTAIRTHALLDNKILTGSAVVIPNVFLQRDTADFNSNTVTFPMLRLIDVSTNTANDVNYKHDEIEYIDISSGLDQSDAGTLSTLVNPTLADLNTLQWLSQFRGRNLIVTYEPSTEGSEWQLFVLDQSTLDGIDVLATSSIPTTVLSGGVEEYFKWQVDTGYYGHNAGTVTAMLASIQFFLTGNKEIWYTMTANSIKFYTNYAETLDATLAEVGSSSPLILQIVEPARPLGMIVEHELILDSPVLTESSKLVFTGTGTYLILEG